MKTVERMYVESLEAAMGSIKLPDSQNQVNVKTGREYKKLNQLILLGKQRELNSKSNQWISKDDLEELGYVVNEGQYGTQLYSYNIKEVEGQKVKVYSYYTVFNLEQLTKKED